VSRTATLASFLFPLLLPQIRAGHEIGPARRRGNEQCVRRVPSAHRYGSPRSRGPGDAARPCNSAGRQRSASASGLSAPSHTLWREASRGTQLGSPSDHERGRCRRRRARQSTHPARHTRPGRKWFVGSVLRLRLQLPVSKPLYLAPNTAVVLRAALAASHMAGCRSRHRCV
jgi:hypothetical protein